MGALTGNTPGSTYLDLVQLGKSGAGLPSHAGKEAALYDGAGNQILGRTAVRHWLDPHPDAASFAETWEFSTTGDMTQGQLETAGWTFSNCTGVVSRGMMLLTAAGGASAKATLNVSLSGDFDIMACCVNPMVYNQTKPTNSYNMIGGFGVADSDADSGNGVAHHGHHECNNGLSNGYSWKTSRYTDLAGGTGASAAVNQSFGVIIRIIRISGGLNVQFGGVNSGILHVSATPPGWKQSAYVVDSSTFDKIFLTPCIENANAGSVSAFTFLRRFD